MDSPVAAVTSAAKSALNLKNILVTLFTLILIAALLDALGWGGWVFQPVTTVKAWLAARKAKN